MKLLHVTFHFEYADAIEEILDRHGVRDFVRYCAVDGGNRDGKHFGSQVYPGSVTAVQAQIPDEDLDAVLADLRIFRDDRPAHAHLEALVLPIEQRL